MKKFLKTSLIFFGILIFPFVLALIVLHDYIPAPKITNSYSFNEKIKFVEIKENKQADYIAIGSSMTLNNINSDVVTELLSTKSYLNLSSWGLRIKDDYILIKRLFEIHKPKTLIIVSIIIDFGPSGLEYNVDDIYDYIDSENEIKYQFKYLELKYFFKRLVTNRINYNTNKIYASLNFDKYGGVALEPDGFEIKKSRWNEKLSYEYIDIQNYLYLDSISSFLTEKNVELIFVQTPLREGLLDDYYTTNLEKHVNKIQPILHKYGHTFCNANNDTWPDSLFVDYAHMNSTGTEKLSKYWIDEYFDRKDNNSLTISD